MDDKDQAFRAALQCISHRMMEHSLRLLDKSGASTSAIHLDHAIATLGLRGTSSTKAERETDSGTDGTATPKVEEQF
jgi:hypothetical protein